MSQAGKERSDQKLKSLQSMVAEAFEHLSKKYPDLRRRKATLLLGRHYAHPRSRVLMLGLNPGLDEELPLDLECQKENSLLGDPGDTEIAYWRNARRLFATTPRLSAVLEYATFSFCCPFRTPSWSSLSSAQRRDLIEESMPTLARILEDCRPEFVIAAGRTAQRILTDRLRPPPQVKSRSRRAKGPIYSWERLDLQWRHLDFAVLQIPHLSRANSAKKLRECGLWLDRNLAA